MAAPQRPLTETRREQMFPVLDPAQVDRLRTEFGIYAVGTGRICVAALNDGNLDRVAEAIAKVI